MMTVFIVVRLVCPAVTAADHARMTTNGAIDVTEARDGPLREVPSDGQEEWTYRQPSN
jgi:hypothetical protein